MELMSHLQPIRCVCVCSVSVCLCLCVYALLARHQDGGEVAADELRHHQRLTPEVVRLALEQIARGIELLLQDRDCRTICQIIPRQVYIA